MVQIVHGGVNSEDALLSAIDVSFTMLCSLSVRDTFYEYCDVVFNLKRNEIPVKLDLFVEALQEATGQAPSKVIMKSVLKLFYANLGVEFDRKNFDERSFQAWVKMRLKTSNDPPTGA